MLTQSARPKAGCFPAAAMAMVLWFCAACTAPGRPTEPNKPAEPVSATPIVATSAPAAALETPAPKEAPAKPAEIPAQAPTSEPGPEPASTPTVASASAPIPAPEATPPASAPEPAATPLALPEDLGPAWTLDFTVFAERLEGARIKVVRPAEGDALRPGDRLRFRVQPDAAILLFVLAVDDQGRVARLQPDAWNSGTVYLSPRTAVPHERSIEGDKYTVPEFRGAAVGKDEHLSLPWSDKGASWFELEEGKVPARLLVFALSRESPRGDPPLDRLVDALAPDGPIPAWPDYTEAPGFLEDFDALEAALADRAEAARLGAEDGAAKEGRKPRKPRAAKARPVTLSDGGQALVGPARIEVEGVIVRSLRFGPP